MENNKSNIDKLLYSESSLGLLNIKELRDMGRKLGMPSPTTMKKDELIDYILKIVYGEVEAPTRSTHGRPNTRGFDMDKFVEKIRSRTSMTDELLQYTLEGGYSLKDSKVAAPKEEYEVETNIEQRVFFDDGEKCRLKVWEFVDSPSDIEVSREFSKKYGLENLDMVELLNQKGAVKIVTINGVKIPDNFENITVCNSPAKRGEKQVFNLSTKEEIKEEIKKIIDQTQKTNLKLFIFSDDEYSSKNVECVTFDKNASQSQIYKTFMIFVGKCEKALFESSDALVVVDGTRSIEKAINSFDEDVSDRIKKHLEEAIGKHLLLGNVLIVFKLDETVIY
ncbi:MAG: Rho termination factor N-terminal domain-containing protein [Clostridia bacterium]|nr:Rho termination factor N-terminal domain-containing protein [Clostridia bacterium]